MDLTELSKLASKWRKFVADHPSTGDDFGFKRNAGYLAGLEVCASQLEDTIARLRADQDA